MEQKIFEKLKNAVEELDAGAAAAAAQEAVAAKLDVAKCIEFGLAEGMNAISEAFDEGDVFIPQLILASKAFDAATDILTANMSVADKLASSRGKVLVHTVSGDIHSIGKNVCATMLGASGFDVFDMGVDVAVEDVVAKAQEINADIILGSALMTTTMPAMKDIVKLLKELGINDKYMTMFGGAPVDADYVAEIGATGYSETATECVKLAISLMEAKNKKGA